MPMADDWITEAQLAIQLRVDRKIIAAARRRLGSDEVADSNGKPVRWLKKVASDFAARLGLSLDAEKTTAAQLPASKPVEHLEVASLPQPHFNGRHFGNHRLIRARRASGELVVVRVADSEKYAPLLRNGQPMIFPAQPASTGNWWVITGREPRWRCQW